MYGVVKASVYVMNSKTTLRPCLPDLANTHIRRRAEIGYFSIFTFWFNGRKLGLESGAVLARATPGGKIWETPGPSWTVWGYGPSGGGYF